VCLFLEDHQLTQPAILELVNSLLASGEVPGLFSGAELEKELQALEAVQADDPLATALSAYQFFVQRVRKVRGGSGSCSLVLGCCCSLGLVGTTAVAPLGLAACLHSTWTVLTCSLNAQNMRVVVSLSPVHADYLARLQANPALLTRCSVQWMDAWSGDALEAIGAHLCRDAIAAEGEGSGVTAALQAIHAVALRRGLALPQHFVSLAKQFSAIHASKRETLTAQISFLQGRIRG